MSYHRGSGRDVRMDRYGNIEEGVNLGSSTVNDLRLGNNVTNTATANVNQAVALGRNTTASGDNSVAIGNSATASATRAIALGESANASASGASALGAFATCSGASAAAVGNSSTASGSNDTAIGNQANASGTFSVAIGRSAASSGVNSTAIGNTVSATQTRSVALGHNVSNSVADSFLFGTNTNHIARFEAPAVITQTGSLTGGVTANTSCGIITAASNYGASGSGTDVGTFTVTCNRCTTDSVVLLSLSNAVTATPVVARACVGSTADGSFTISFQNPDGAAATVAAPKYHFQIFNPKNV